MMIKRKPALIWLGAIFAALGVLWLLYWLIIGRFAEYTDDAYVAGNTVQLMPQIPGTVIAINADDTDLVEQGEVVIKLDPADVECEGESWRDGAAS
jgi:membrane fusion protein, multidrug efflux system